MNNYNKYHTRKISTFNGDYGLIYDTDYGQLYQRRRWIKGSIAGFLYEHQHQIRYMTYAILIIILGIMWYLINKMLFYLM